MNFKKEERFVLRYKRGNATPPPPLLDRLPSRVSGCRRWDDVCAGRDSFPFKQSAMSVRSKLGPSAGVCTLSLYLKGIPWPEMMLFFRILWGCNTIFYQKRFDCDRKSFVTTDEKTNDSKIYFPHCDARRRRNIHIVTAEIL